MYKISKLLLVIAVLWFLFALANLSGLSSWLFTAFLPVGSVGPIQEMFYFSTHSPYFVLQPFNLLLPGRYFEIFVLCCALGIASICFSRESRRKSLALVGSCAMIVVAYFSAAFTFLDLFPVYTCGNAYISPEALVALPGKNGAIWDGL